MAGTLRSHVGCRLALGSTARTICLNSELLPSESEVARNLAGCAALQRRAARADEQHAVERKRAHERRGHAARNEGGRGRVFFHLLARAFGTRPRACAFGARPRLGRRGRSSSRRACRVSAVGRSVSRRARCRRSMLTASAVTRPFCVAGTPRSGSLGSWSAARTTTVSPKGRQDPRAPAQERAFVFFADPLDQLVGHVAGRVVKRIYGVRKRAKAVVRPWEPETGT